MDAGMIGGVRRFNRAVTQRIGALDDAFLARERPLGQARLLWEIGPDGSDVRALRARLDLDSGYLSRLLRCLAGDGLITVTPSQADGRVRMAALTSAGRAERAELDRLSDDAAGAILSPLSDRQRDRLVAAMAEVERLLTASAIELAGSDPRTPAARACQLAYASELASRFEAGYDPAQTMTMDDADLIPPAGLLLIASLHGEPVGCGAVMLAGTAPAKIRRMWVSATVRGQGLGRRILAGLETHAAAAGASTVRLETNRALTEAISLYRSAGYREVPPFSDEHYAHHWFEKTLPVSRDQCAGR